MGYVGKDGKIEGDKSKLKHNHKLQPILELLRKDPYIEFIGKRPIVMRWNQMRNLTQKDKGLVTLVTLVCQF